MKENALKDDFISIRETARELEEMGILRIFLRSAVVGRDGTITRVVDIKRFRNFSDLLRNWNEEFAVVPWIGFNTNVSPITDPVFRKNFVEHLRGLVRGLSPSQIHLDIEPVSPVEDFFSLIAEVRMSLQGIYISVASPKLTLKGFEIYEGVREQFWDIEALMRLCMEVNEIVIMFYDTGFYRVGDYVKYVKDSLTTLLPLTMKAKCQVSAGIPVYYEPSRRHNPAVENIENFLKAMKEIFYDPRFAVMKFSGFSIYDYKNFDKIEMDMLKNFMEIYGKAGEKE
uniref:Uncharacterized protein n=1 Tax=uncultured prokaryote TaxID=198431 RepID=H5SPY3_9ZZZZ|nr:hypothetical protein HGMM_F55D02C19 [uncultured prokaryote]